MTNTIILRRGEQVWTATFVGPHAERIRDLFGSVMLPLPFRPAAGADQVRVAVQARNPGVVVVVEG